MSASVGARILKAFERAESRLGFLLGAAVALIVAALFAFRGLSAIERLDLAAVDYFFRLRPPPPVSREITMIYFDDVAARQRKRVYRDDTARVLRSLTRLGARMVMLDVEYVSDFRGAAEAPADGSLTLDADTRFLARAIEASGRTLINYNFERAIEHIDSRLARAVIDRLKARLTVESRDLPGLSAEDRRQVESAFTNLRQIAANERVAELLAAEPGLSFGAIRDRLLTPREIEVHDGTVADLLRAFHAIRVMKIFESRQVAREIRGIPPAVTELGLLRPTIPEIAERVLTAGHATTPDRDVDGVLRRAPLVVRTPHGLVPYTGLETAAKALDDASHRASLVFEVDAVTVLQLARDGGAETRRIRIPIEPDGRVLADWGTPFDELSFAKLLEEDKRRTQLLVTNLGRCVEDLKDTINAEEFAPVAARQAELKAQWERAETDLAAPLSELAEVERATVAWAGEIAGRLKVEAARRREHVAKVPPRSREGILAAIAKSELLIQDLEAGLRDNPDVRSRIEGRICFFGSKSTETGDLFSTPLASEAPGVDLHANVAAMILRGRTIRYAPAWLNFALIAVVGLAVSAGVSAWTLSRGSLLTAGLVAASTALFAGVGIRSSVLLSGAGPAACSFAVFTVAVSWRELVARRSQRKLQKELARHTSPDLVSIIMADPERFSRPRQTTATIFFSDVKGFTSIGEKMDAEQLVRFMNRYLDRMTQILMERQAYLDKYIGDGIMALFGVPVETPEHARLACYAALENVSAAARLSDELVREGLPPISIRVGLNSGEIVAAYVGATDRADYTAIGDAVNLASRLEGANKRYGTQIMVSETTFELTRHAFWYRELDRIRVVGKKKGIRVYELLAQKGVAHPFPAGFLDAYHEGVGAFEQRDWARARAAFARAMELMPDDAPARMYVDRCDGFLLRPPEPGWDGVFDLTEK